MVNGDGGWGLNPICFIKLPSLSVLPLTRILACLLACIASSHLFLPLLSSPLLHCQRAQHSRTCAPSISICLVESVLSCESINQSSWVGSCRGSLILYLYSVVVFDCVGFTFAVSRLQLDRRNLAFRVCSLCGIRVRSQLRSRS